MHTHPIFPIGLDDVGPEAADSTFESPSLFFVAGMIFVVGATLGCTALALLKAVL